MKKREISGNNGGIKSSSGENAYAVFSACKAMWRQSMQYRKRNEAKRQRKRSSKRYDATQAVIYLMAT